MKIGIDLDGPLFNFVGAYLRFHNRVYGTSFSLKDIINYDMSEIFGVSHEQHGRDIFAFFDSPEFSTIQPVSAAIPRVRQLSQQYTLWVVTARSLCFQELTAASVQRHYDGCFQGVYHTTGNAFQLHADKAGTCKQLGLDLLIEDSVRNAVEVMEAGIPALLIARPWNNHVRLPPYLRRTQWGHIQPAIKKTLVRQGAY